MEQKKTYIIYTLFIVAMSMMIILSGDDLSWGTNLGIRRLHDNFENYNGRYLGNYIIILITRSSFLKVIVYTVTNVSILWLMHNILEKRIRIEYLVLILTTIPMNIFRQTYGWLSGFANYNISLALVLLLFYLVFVRQQNYPIFMFIMVLFLAIASQLFVENITLANIAMSFLSVIIYLFFNRRKLVLALSWLSGSLIGGWVMFSNSAYSSSSDSTRGISNVHLSEVMKHLLQDFSELVVKQNIILILSFSFLIYMCFLSNENKYSKVLGYYLLFLNTYLIFRRLLGVTFNNLTVYVLIVELLMIFIFILLIFVTGIKYINKKDKFIFFLSLLFVILISSPFMVVTPFGPRNVLAPYVLLVIPLSLLLIEVYGKYSFIIIPKIIRTMSIVTTFVIFQAYLINYIENIKIINNIKAADSQGTSEIIIENVPFENLGQQINQLGKNNTRRSNEYKEYYDISENIEIKFVRKTKPLRWQQDNY
ncbi:DUF6056 family protein [Vagococcus lutrae]|uniref:DUF6056 family protein n=1 Tax=Vagococcus lutrae TaxID=81947 RepID=UPI00288F50B6|nr:DUF6056 family protein [Vagococcus lutrae]MDT2808604.1 DUF6056 family protein [Vagococcus lutrae]